MVVIMFGYVGISNETISQEDKSLYQSYYCGLCKAIGRKSQLYRFGLNNDLTFLAILLSAVIPEEPETLSGKGCLVHHIKKHDEIAFNNVMDYVSDMNILLVYLKICDDIRDNKSVPKYLLKKILQLKTKHIADKYTELEKELQNQLDELQRLEQDNSSLIDRTADCFANMLKTIFVPDFITDEATCNILSWIGYNIGRWIYIVDAYDDLEKDKRTGNYNTFLSAGADSCEEIKADTYNALIYTLSNAANAYDLLTIYRNDSLLRNILYTGLYGRLNSVFVGMEEKNEPL